jgi:hydroxymethylpyrimidine/phosphomethylpyrimidine kinase
VRDASGAQRGGGVARPRALTIAGSDSGGGAGIQADLKTFSALGVYGMTAVTAVTIQNTKGVWGYEAIPPEAVAAQIRAVVEDIGADAAKTGMLASARIVDAVVEALGETPCPNLVVDPVFASKHGQSLLDDDAVNALRRRLLPLATLATPNLPEAGGLIGRRVETREDMVAAAKHLHSLGARAVLLKGGHQGDPASSADLFYDGERQEWLEAARVDTPHTHGTGCTLAAAIAAHLARGEELLDAVRAGKAFVTEAIRHALEIGSGIGPVDQLWPIPR